jgi:valyl-tRNA synthetase
MADTPNPASSPAVEDPEKLALRKEKKAEKDAAKAAKIAKAKAKQEKEAAAKAAKDKAVQEAQASGASAASSSAEPKKEKEIRLKKEFVNTTAPGEKKDLSAFPLDADSSYDPPSVEASWYSWWEKQGFFSPDVTNKDGEVFSIVIPPPNVTGSLHLGHALTNSIQDTIVRFHRMNGKRVLWVPGTDHAGIATQAVVEKKLWKTEKKTRQEMGREEFVARVWEWKGQYGNRITDQLRRIGSSLDWSRERFTLDERLSRAVVEAFVRLSRSGKIYRGTRLVNWSCKLRTAISDIEVDTVELTKKTKMKIPGHNPDKLYEFGALWEFAYRVKGGAEGEELVVATTRPETMLGDVAVAVHPKDTRYQHLIGKELVHPFLPNRVVKVIGDDVLVDMNFGTGAVKITPAHDPNDYACGERHGLEKINILNLDGTINANGGKYEGMMRFDARIAVLGDLKAAGLYRGVKDNAMNIGKCSRSGDIIEPLLVPQWWVKCGDMAKRALDVVKNGELEILPEMHVATWNSWLTDIRDWCISRQLWWGHRIPAWLVHLKDQAPSNPATQEFWVVAHNETEARQLAEEKWPGKVASLEQDPDVLDTWFSSGLFPFSVFGWPESGNAADMQDLAQFYPTSLLETGHDILFFWVARMVMMGLELTDKLPFKQVLLHAMVRDAHGRKMSKSLGNVVDPIDVMEGITKAAMIEKLKDGNLEDAEIAKATQGILEDFPNGISECGTDALRFALCAYTSQGRDINLDIQRVQAYRNFCNKLWNATKLGFMVMGILPKPTGEPHTLPAFHPLASSQTTTGAESSVDLWVLSRLQVAIKDSWDGFASYDFSKVTTAIYAFWLYDFCDVYLEAVKPEAFASEPNQARVEAIRQTIYTCLDEGLRLLHPFMPFLSEDLWQRLERRPDQLSIPSICLAPYPKSIEARYQQKIEEDVAAAQTVISATRNMRAEYNIAKKITPPLIINTHTPEHQALYSAYAAFIQVLTYCGETSVALNADIPAGSAAAIPNATAEVYLLIKGLVNVEQEVAKLNAKIANSQKQRDALAKKMALPTYKNVPETVQQGDSKKLQAFDDELKNLATAITNFQKLQ